jgi:glycosyltransferase involved in cell wall biosynthesis
MTTKKKTVLVKVVSNLEFGGAQRQIVELVNGLDRDVYDVHLVSLSDYVPLGESLRDPNCLTIIEKRHKYDFTVVFKLAKLLKALRADIVQGYLFDAEIAALLAGWLARTKLIVSSERNTNYAIKRIQRVFYALTKALPDICIANSHSGAEYNSKVLNRPLEMFRVVHNGVDSNDRFFPQDDKSLRKTFDLNESDFVVGMFGSFKEQKNHPQFFRAAKLILESHPKTKFLLVGDQLYGGMHGSDEYKDQVFKLIEELDLKANCRFLGNRNDVEALYTICDVTILPSFFEGTPNVALESMSCGVPVIATDVSDNAYIVPHERAGYIVKVNDDRSTAQYVVDLIENEEKRKRLATGAREWVESEFSISKLVEKTDRIYREALSTKL